MQRKWYSYIPAIALACILALFGIGASAQTHTFRREQVTVSISPVSATLLTGGAQQFTATVTGSRNTAVTWSATGGTISSSGLYTAPTTTGAYTVTAASEANSTNSASATVTVAATPAVAVSISPVSTSLLTGGAQQFTAYVTGSSNTAVTWSTTGGTVSTNGLYSAPATAGTYTVTATSVADTTESASAAVTVTASSPDPLTFVQVAAATPRSPQSAVTVVYPAPQTAGDLNVVVVGWNDSTSSATSVSDSSGNAYTLAVGPTKGTGLSQSIYYAKNIASGSNTVTVAFNQAAAYPDIRILEYAGLDTVSPLDVTAAGVGNSNSASSGPATTTATSELILGADTIATTTTGPGSGFTSRIITSPDSNLVEDKVVSTTGSYSATATLSSGSWVMQMATFKAAGSTTPPAVAVSVSPSSANLTTGATQQLTATVTGTTNTAVTWSASCGTVTASGLYTASTAAGSCTVKATSQADSTKSASATVTVTAPIVVAVSISPVSASLLTGGTQQFTAYITDSSNTAVTWSTTGGIVSSGGLYTAPAAAGTYSVTATSQADSTKSASATVIVTTPVVAVSISPVSASLLTGGTQQFTPTVTGSSNTAVTWSTTSGTVSTNGLYSAPATAGTYTVTATSIADTTKSATASVTVTSSSADSPTLVQHVSCPNAGATGSGVGGAQSSSPVYLCPLPEPTQAGNAILLGFFSDNTGSPTWTVSDDKSNSWTLAGSTTDSEGNIIAVYYALNVAAGTRMLSVKSSAQTAGYLAVSASEYYNVATSSALDTKNCNAGSSSTSITAGSITPGTSGDLLWQWAANANAAKLASITVGSQSNITWQLNGTDIHDGDVTQAGVYNSTSAINPTFTSGTAEPFDSCVMALKAANAGNAPTNAFRIVHMLHAQMASTDSSPYAMQFPTSGNLVVMSFISGSTTISNITSSPSNTWSSTGSAVTYGSQVASQMYYAANATTSNSMTLSITLSGGITGLTFMMYDFTGAATSPFDQDSGGQSNNQASIVSVLTTCSGCLSPPAGNEAIVGNFGQAWCTSTGINSPNGALFDAATYTGNSVNGPEGVDQNNGWFHYYDSGTSAITAAWSETCGSTQEGSWAGRVAAFKAAQ